MKLILSRDEDRADTVDNEPRISMEFDIVEDIEKFGRPTYWWIDLKLESWKVWTSWFLTITANV